MKKIIELLNERKGSKLYYAANGSIRMVGEFPISELEIISKKFGFIERLVKNNKIDFDKLEKIGHEETVYEYDGQYKKFVEYSNYETLLMILSISDSPIDDLLLYLK